MLTENQKKEIIRVIRGTSTVIEQISDEYKLRINLSVRREYQVSTSAGMVTCYVFTAKNREPGCRVHINIHGGGFIKSHAERDELYSSGLADKIHGIVVDVDYALSPEYPYPVAFNQCYDVCSWVFGKLNEWDGDPKRVSLGGHSAGANLTAAICLKAGQTGDFRICLQVLDYGFFDLLTDPSEKPEADTNLIPVERARLFTLAYTNGDLNPKPDPFMSPSCAPDYMLQGLPEALVIAAGKDNFRFENLEYARRLALNGVRVTAKCIPEAKHGFIVFCSEGWEEGQALVIEAILRAALS